MVDRLTFYFLPSTFYLIRMSFIDDLEDLSIFTAGEFSDVGSVVSPTALYSQISGIFDENVDVMLDLGGVDSSVGGRQFSFKVNTIHTDGLRYGDSITIRARNFQITSIDPYGDGRMSELKLKEYG